MSGMTIAMRLIHLERDNARLNARLCRMQSRFAATRPGHYLATDDGGLDGPYRDIAEAVRTCVEDGASCTVIEVKSRHEPKAPPEDFGVIPGVDYPATLGRPIINWLWQS